MLEVAALAVFGDASPLRVDPAGERNGRELGLADSGGLTTVAAMAASGFWWGDMAERRVRLHTARE